jgi:hypothetical protein
LQWPLVDRSGNCWRHAYNALGESAGGHWLTWPMVRTITSRALSSHIHHSKLYASAVCNHICTSTLQASRLLSRTMIALFMISQTLRGFIHRITQKHLYVVRHGQCSAYGAKFLRRTALGAPTLVHDQQDDEPVRTHSVQRSALLLFQGPLGSGSVSMRSHMHHEERTC